MRGIQRGCRPFGTRFCCRQSLVCYTFVTVLGNSEFVLTIFGALAQEESANTSKRIKFGKKVNAENGKVPNLVYGYDKTIGDYFNLTVNPQEAAVVREIFDMYIKGGDGASRIASALNARGVKTKRGCGWSQNAVCRILTNELYTGRVVNGKEVLEINKAERHIRGGLATRKKYKGE